MNPTWRVYYDDGSTFDSTQGAPNDAPGLGVQAIVQVHPDVGREILTRFDFYYFVHDLGVWWASDLFGTIDQFVHHPKTRGALKAGRNAAAYDAIMKRAMTDPDFPAKSARLAGERG